MNEQHLYTELVTDKSARQTFSLSFSQNHPYIFGYIWQLARKAIPEVKGVTWDFVELSNGGKFISPSITEVTMFGQQISGKLAGVVIVLHTLKRFQAVATYSNEYEKAQVFEQQHTNLLEYVEQDPERDKALGTLDSLQELLNQHH